MLIFENTTSKSVCMIIAVKYLAHFQNFTLDYYSMTKKTKQTAKRLIFRLTKNDTANGENTLPFYSHSIVAGGLEDTS